MSQYADDWPIMRLAEAGRGLALVDALCDRLTWQPNNGDDQRWRIEKRAEAQAMRDRAADDGQDAGELEELTAELDQEITGAGMRGNVLPARAVRRDARERAPGPGGPAAPSHPATARRRTATPP